MTMRKYSRILCAVLVLFLLPVQALAVTELDGSGHSYIFDAGNTPVAAPFPYVLEERISLARISNKLASLEDMTVDEQGRIYIADKNNECIYVLENGSIVNTIRKYEWQGSSYALIKPEGVYWRDGKLYIANTGAKNVVVLNEQYEAVRVVDAPAEDEWSSTVPFEPVRICADGGERIYVLSRNQTQGIVQFSRKGTFIGFLGATRVNPSAMQLLYRSFATEEMKKRMLQFIPTEYSNIAATDNGMIFAITEVSGGTVADRVPVRLINPVGNNILRTNGYSIPVGNVDALGTAYASRLTDVAVGPDGLYSLLDNKNKRVFTYDVDGNLLYVFGKTDDNDSFWQNGVSMVYHGRDIYILDKGDGSLLRFKPTEFGNQIMQAYQCHAQGDFDGETACWEQVQSIYQGYYLAYFGLGKVAMNDGDYETAMSYFRLSNQPTFYSKAYKLNLAKVLEENLLWMIAGAAILVGGLILLNKFRGKHGRMPSFISRVFQSGIYVMTHPFNGFWELKWERKGKVSEATALLAATMLVNMICAKFTPYIFNTALTEQTNIVVPALSYLLLIGLWIVANWCFTTLFDGKGTMKDIYIYTCYSLFPYALLSLPVMLLSLVLTLENASIYHALQTFITIYMAFLIFTGTLTVHQYSIGRTILMIILSIVGIMILIFLMLLCFNLGVDIYDFISSAIREIIYRYTA